MVAVSALCSVFTQCRSTFFLLQAPQVENIWDFQKGSSLFLSLLLWQWRRCACFFIYPEFYGGISPWRDFKMCFDVCNTCHVSQSNLCGYFIQEGCFFCHSTPKGCKTTSWSPFIQCEWNCFNGTLQRMKGTDVDLIMVLELELDYL